MGDLLIPVSHWALARHPLTKSSRQSIQVSLFVVFLSISSKVGNFLPFFLFSSLVITRMLEG